MSVLSHINRDVTDRTVMVNRRSRPL